MQATPTDHAETALDSAQSERLPNPRRVAAGRRNRQQRGPLTPGGRQRLREAALRNRPWLRSTGPRTAQGRRQTAQNGRRRQRGTVSRRELQRELHAILAHSGSLWQRLGETTACPPAVGCPETGPTRMPEQDRSSEP